MEHAEPANEPVSNDDQSRSACIEAAIREAAFQAWAEHREPGQETSRALFDRAYRGHHAALAAYTEDLVDDYDLDAKLDAAIAEPFRRHVDIDVAALSRTLAASGQYYALRAIPVGVWVFAEVK